MKTTLIISALAVVLITGCAPVQQSADTTTSPAASESTKHMPYQGTIMAMDISAGTVTIQTDQGSMTIVINESTKFRGGTGGLGDFKVGDKISGMFMMDDSGRMMAVSIRPYSSKE